MDDSTANLFSDCIVSFELAANERFSIIPVVYHGYYGDDGALLSNMLGVDFELHTEGFSRQVGDIIFVESFVRVREFLANVKSAKVGESLDFKTKERVVAMSLSRQEATLRIAGQFPTDESPWVHYSDFQSELERRFETQVSFYCNFPFDKTPAVVGQMDKLLQAIDYPG